MELSIVIPAYNDSISVVKLVEEVDRIIAKITKFYEILVVDDGSKDDTKKVILDLAKKYKKLKPLFHEKNKGYGEALKTLYSNSKGDFIINLPGDNQIPASNILKFIKAPENIDIVIGYRKKRMDSNLRKIYSFIYNIILSIISGKRVHDVDSAKRISRRLLNNIKLKYDNSFRDTELVLKSIFNNYNLIEIEIEHQRRLYGVGSTGKPKIIFSILYSLIKFLIKREYKNN